MGLLSYVGQETTFITKLLEHSNLSFAFVLKPRQNLTSKRKKNVDMNF
jgi:hypothetical protein